MPDGRLPWLVVVGLQEENGRLRSAEGPGIERTTGGRLDRHGAAGPDRGRVLCHDVLQRGYSCADGAFQRPKEKWNSKLNGVMSH